MEYKHYIYFHRRSDNNEIFYVGIGTISPFGRSHKTLHCRAFDRGTRNRFWKNIVKKTKYTVEIIETSDDRMEMVERERFFIKFYGRRDLGEGTLVNLEDGETGERRRGNNPRKKPVYIYHIDGHFIERYSCRAEAAIALNTSRDAMDPKHKYSLNFQSFYTYQGENIEPIDCPWLRKYRTTGPIEVLNEKKELIHTFNSWAELGEFYNCKQTGKMKIAMRDEKPFHFSVRKFHISIIRSDGTIFNSVSDAAKSINACDGTIYNSIRTGRVTRSGHSFDQVRNWKNEYIYFKLVNNIPKFQTISAAIMS